MGQFPKIHPTEPRMDRFAILAIFLAAAVSAAPLEDTAEVAAAKAEFQAVFKMAAEGKLGELAPVNADQQAEQIPTAYIADTSDVAAAKAEFASAFALAESGELAQLAPVNNDVQADPVVATYIADTDDVNAAKAKFMAAFEDAKLAAEQAPEAVEEPAAVAAPVVNALPFASAFPYTVSATPLLHHVYSLPYVFPLAVAPVQNAVSQAAPEAADSEVAVEAV